MNVQAHLLAIVSITTLALPQLAPARNENAPNPELAAGVTSDDETLVAKIREFVVETSKERAEKDMRPYKNTIPLTGAAYEMVAIPGGKFLMGSPADEPHRKEDEGPQREIAIGPFWMGKFEVTWPQFEPFLVDARRRSSLGIPRSLSKTAVLPDFVSSPSLPYLEMDFGMGKEGGYPAISMTQHAASKFCQWLSAQTGHFYRLPTEAEWEYACRAGSTTAFYHGNDIEKLEDYAWYWHQKGPDQYAKVGLKKPNAWGLHDMLGNVSEWCLDQYRADAYHSPHAFTPPETLYPRVFRGGSWDDDPEDLRASRRFFSTVDLKSKDPTLPRSIWHNTDAQFLGFRIVRPLQTPDVASMDAAWNGGDYTELEGYTEKIRAKRREPIPRKD